MTSSLFLFKSTFAHTLARLGFGQGKQRFIVYLVTGLALVTVVVNVKIAEAQTSQSTTSMAQLVEVGEPETEYFLSLEETRWLREHPVLRHGVIDGHRPFEYIDEEQIYRGLTSDYMKILGEQLGIRFEIVVTQKFDVLGQGLADGDLDIASYLPPAWPDVVEYSAPIIEMPIVMFGRQDAALLTGLEALDDERVIVERPSRAQELLMREYPNLSLIYVETPAEGIMAVAEGDADIFIHNVFSVEYYQRKLGLKPLKVVASTPYFFNISLAVNPDFRSLIPMIHKVVGGLSEREKRLIFDKWINVEVERQFNFRVFIYWICGA